MRRLLIVAGIIFLMLSCCSSLVLAAVPTVTTSNADIDGTSVTLNGNITVTGVVGDDDIRGFVWDDMTGHANPGNVAPGISGYNNNWTEAGSFDTGAFSHEVTGLSALVTHYYRACAHSDDGWAYGEELTFFTLVDGKVYLEFRPDLSESRITGNAANPSVPTDVLVGLFPGYSMPVWDEDNEELYFEHCVPNRWDANSDPIFGSHILVHIDSSLTNINQSGFSYTLQLAWNHVTPNEEEVPIDAPDALHTSTITRQVWSDDKECYQDWFIILYNADFPDNVVVDDLLGIRVRRIDTEGQKELVGEVIIHHVGILYARGDLLGDPEGTILTLINIWIEEGLLIGGEDVFFLALILLALAFTIASYIFKKGVLAFAGAGSWAIASIYCFIESTEAWDIYFSLAFLFIGLLFACMFSPLAWRETTSAGEIPEEPDIAEMRADTEAFNKGRNQYSFLHSKGRPRRKSRW